MMKPLRRPLRGRPLAGSWMGRDLWRGAKGIGGSGDSAIRPGAAQLTWAGYAPSTVSGVGWSISPGVGQATWSGLQPSVQVPVSVSPGVAAMSWTGPAPTITGLTPDGQIVMRNGDTLIDRAGDPIINVAQS